MGRSRSASWIAGAVILALLIMAGAWLLLISPTLEEAADTRSRAESEESRGDQLEIQLAALRRDFENIDVLRAELDELRVSVPTESRLSELTRQVNALAATSGVFIVGAQTVHPALLAAPGAAATDPTAAGSGDTTGSGDATESADGAATDQPVDPAAGQDQAAPTTGLYAVAVDWTILGDFATTVSFIERLQAESPRLVVVTGLQATTQEPAGAQAGKPEILDGFIETIVRTYVYAYPSDGQPIGDEEAEQTEPPTMPVPVVPRNPFLQNATPTA